eukprot:TRINITY_DN5269_c0_g1_i1.p1 TRINITY_DN5269_c0_g1~~TRINITY_DN5269_c0_g1_i1.p1  ORF type:complete len:1210 (+),score=328.81 TRINITY_DN5269_c0_g1_i1:460-3630(+)
MERQVEEEDKHRKTASNLALHRNLPQNVNCEKCGNLFMADSNFCRQCGWKREVVIDSVDALGQRLAALEKQREAAELRSSHLTELRRIVSEGRQQNFLSLSDDSFALRKKGRGGKEDGEASVADTYNMSTVLTGSEEEEEVDAQAAEVLAELESKFLEELETAGDSSARSRLHDRLQSLMQALLRRERAMEDRIAEHQAAVEEHRLAAEAAGDSQRSAEQDLRVLEEHSQTVLNDCRALQARLQQLEHSNACEKAVREATEELEDKTKDLEETLQRQRQEFEMQLQDKDKLLEISHAREAGLQEELAQLESSLQSMKSSIQKHAAEQQRMQMLELEHQELISSHVRQQQVLKDRVQELEGEHAETKERLSSYAKQHGELRGASADLEGQLAKAEEKSAEHARHSAEAQQRLAEHLAGAEKAREEIEKQEQRIAELEKELQESKECEQRLSQHAAAASLASSEQIAYLEGLLAEEQESQAELERKHHEHTQAHTSSFSDLQHHVRELEAGLHQERETNKELRVELLEAKDRVERVQHDSEQMHQRCTRDEERLKDLENRNAFLNDQLEKERAKSAVVSLPLGLSSGIPSGRRPSGSSTGSGAGDFRRKAKVVKRRAAELLYKTAEPHGRVLDLELAAAVESWREGHSLHEGAARFYAGKAEALQERQALASLVEAAEHDLCALKEEALTHHELSQHELEEMVQQIELDVQCCRDEKTLLQLASPFAAVPEELLQGIAASLGLLYHGPPENLGLRHWPDGQTPMHWAALNGRRDIVEFLLKHEGGKQLVNLPDGQGRTPLELAESRQHVTLCHYLLERAGATKERKGSQVSAVSSGKEDVSCSSDNDLPDKYQAVLAQVEQQGWNTVAWKDGFTMLHWAASKGKVNLCHHLVSLNADPEARDKHGRTALDCAEEGGHMQAADMLKSRIRNRLLGRLSSRSRSDLSLSAAALSTAPTTKPRSSTRRKSVMLPETYLPVLEEIDRVGWQNMTWARGFTLLHWAAKNDAPELVDKFISQGADPLQADDSGKTALDYARDSGSLAVVAALRKHAPPLSDTQE